MRLTETKTSRDGTKKFVFITRDDLPCEVSLIRKNTKDILVVPSQTGCLMGCAFCPLRTAGGIVHNLDVPELANAIAQAIQYGGGILRDTLLISFMGAGEPLCNQRLVSSFTKLGIGYGVRVCYAFASIIPSERAFENFTSCASGHPVKLHWSLHFTQQNVRNRYMTEALPLAQALPLIRQFVQRYPKCNPVEVHYTLIRGVNDTHDDLDRLSLMFAGTNITVKLLQFSEPPLPSPGTETSVLAAGRSELKSLFASPPGRVVLFANELTARGCTVEVYDPPGRDIGASCGMFEVECYQ
jgi:23S rRNA (adenine2503-C2)-methyltransferase